MFSKIADAIIAIAGALMAREHNVLLRMIAENSQQIHEAKNLLYSYEDAAADPAAIERTKLWLHGLESQKALLFAAAGRTAPKAADPAGNLQAGAGAGDKKP